MFRGSPHFENMVDSLFTSLQMNQQRDTFKVPTNTTSLPHKEYNRRKVRRKTARDSRQRNRKRA